VYDPYAREFSNVYTHSPTHLLPHKHWLEISSFIEYFVMAMNLDKVCGFNKAKTKECHLIYLNGSSGTLREKMFLCNTEL
jgi:hypothetical protein